jgi:shikimate dehydrogenase
VKLAVIGDPAEHSKSPALHAAFLHEAGIQGTYEAIRVPAGTCSEAVERLRAEGYLGLNVTTPLKEEAHALCDVLDEVARAAASVNTLTLHASRIIGANTDGIGALLAVQSALGTGVAEKTVLLLGVGPTARAAAWVLQAHGARVLLWNRTAERARAVARAFKLEIWEPGRSVHLVLSTLPPNADLDPTLLQALRDAPIVLDANYGPRATLARNIARETIDGEGMLTAQARASFDIWHCKTD